jgi:hypothetical protein
MELDELKQQWIEHDRKLETNLRLTRSLLNASKLNRTRSALHRMAFFLALESAIALAVIVALGSFIGDHITMPRFLIPAAVLDIFEIGMLIALVQQIGLALQIDYDKPVVTIQTDLERLRVLSIRGVLWTLIAAPLLWTPLLIVGLKAFLGLDAYQLFGSAYLLANLAIGVAVIGLAVWISKTFGSRMKGSPRIQALMGTIAGHNLNAATRFLASLSEFEKERPA